MCCYDSRDKAKTTTSQPKSQHRATPKSYSQARRTLNEEFSKIPAAESSSRKKAPSNNQVCLAFNLPPNHHPLPPLHSLTQCVLFPIMRLAFAEQLSPSETWMRPSQKHQHEQQEEAVFQIISQIINPVHQHSAAQRATRFRQGRSPKDFSH